jgi:hypothetical protein
MTMYKTILATLESKKFVVGILTTLAAIAARKGFDVDTTTILVCISPIMAAIGAQGWADSGKEAAKIAAAADPTSAKPGA